MYKHVQSLGLQSHLLLERFGRSGLFLARTVFRKPRLLRIFPALVAQLYAVGFLSLLVISLAGLFIGMVIALQGHAALSRFGATSQVGPLLALSILRELGPVITALLFAGRAGSALTAEIGLMKTTEQLASMEMMGVDPLWRVIFPRFWAGMIAMPLLTIIFSAIAIMGGYLAGVVWLGIDSGSFWSNMQSAVDFRLDVLNGVIKSIVFGIVVTWIAVFQGYETTPTPAGTARATTRSVVYGSLAVLFLDLILTTLMIGGW